MYNYRVGHYLLEKIRAYRNANSRISELVIRLEGMWLKAETQVAALAKAEHHTHERLRLFHEECVRRLTAKLCAANAAIKIFTDEPVEESSRTQVFKAYSPARKLRYTMLEKHLEKTIHDLVIWHAVFDPSWYLITLQAGAMIDSVLADHSGVSAGLQEINTVATIRSAIHDIRTQKPMSSSVFRDNGFVASDEVRLTLVLPQTRRHIQRKRIKLR